MNNNFSWENFINNLNSHLSNQDRKICELENTIRELKKQLSEMASSRQVSIDKIEYKFDQLKVEKLEGTLNIGLNPFSGEAIEDFSVKNSALDVNLMPFNQDEFARNLSNSAQEFLNNEGKLLIDQIAAARSVNVSDDISMFILDDIKRQMPARLHYHQQMLIQQSGNQIPPNELHTRVLAALESDLKQAIEVFLSNLPQESSEV
ncbi:MAG: spore germination protein GerPC [Bacillales bacterium]|jgi:spore germination protein PC|nr:spore germination protein GerPC [Bacillales bacterium]